MNKIFFIIIILLAVIIFVGFWLNKNMETIKMCFNENCFIAEVAKNKADRTRGLMFRESLANDGAMLFVFPDVGLHNFWMKNCLIPLDIIWLDENYKVVAIKPNNQPCPKTGDCPSITPGVVVKYALEINAGFSSQLNLAIGSQSTLIPLDK